jgi:hypothetical protein
MRRTTLGILAIVAQLAPVAAAGMLVLPSGETAQPLPVIWDEDMSVIRLRYIVERLNEPASLYAGDAQRVFDDMEWLCETQLSSLFGEGVSPQDDGWFGAVVTLMDRDVEFGTVDTDSTQLFEWFSFGMDGCEIDLDLYDE